MERENDNQDVFDQSEKPSKSAVKREMLALQDLGKTLCDLPFEKVKRAPISEPLMKAIIEYHKCNAHGAKKRQLQYIGKVIRQHEETPEEIDAWINGETVEQKLKTLHMHAAETWRDRMVQDPALLSTFIESYPKAARENLNPLIRQASVEKATGKSPKNLRQLYKILYQFIQEGGGDNK